MQLMTTKKIRVEPITLVVGSWSSFSLSSRIAFSWPCMYSSSWSEQTQQSKQLCYAQRHM